MLLAERFAVQDRAQAAGVDELDIAQVEHDLLGPAGIVLAFCGVARSRSLGGIAALLAAPSRGWQSRLARDLAAAVSCAASSPTPGAPRRPTATTRRRAAPAARRRPARAASRAACARRPPARAGAPGRDDRLQVGARREQLVGESGLACASPQQRLGRARSAARPRAWAAAGASSRGTASGVELAGVSHDRQQLLAAPAQVGGARRRGSVRARSREAGLRLAISISAASLSTLCTGRS